MNIKEHVARMKDGEKRPFSIKARDYVGTLGVDGE